MSLAGGFIWWWQGGGGAPPVVATTRGGFGGRRIKRGVKHEVIEDRGKTLRELFEPGPPRESAQPPPMAEPEAPAAAQEVSRETLAPDLTPLIDGLKSLRTAFDAAALAQAIEDDDAEVLTAAS